MIKGNLAGLTAETVSELNKFDSLVEGDLIVTSAFRAGDTGEHGKGLAVDIVAPAYAGRLMDLYLLAERAGWQGIGMYPTWSLNGKIHGGLHLDKRVGQSARWMGLGSGKSQQYVALNQENLRKHGVV